MGLVMPITEVAGILALLGGLALMWGWLSKFAVVRFVARAITEFFRGVPAAFFANPRTDRARDFLDSISHH